MSRAVKSRDRSLPPGKSSALGASNPGLTRTYISHLRLSLTCVEGTPRCNLRVEPERSISPLPSHGVEATSASLSVSPLELDSGNAARQRFLPQTSAEAVESTLGPRSSRQSLSRIGAGWWSRDSSGMYAYFSDDGICTAGSRYCLGGPAASLAISPSSTAAGPGHDTAQPPRGLPECPYADMTLTENGRACEG